MEASLFIVLIGAALVCSVLRGWVCLRSLKRLQRDLLSSTPAGGSSGLPQGFEPHVLLLMRQMQHTVWAAQQAGSFATPQLQRQLSQQNSQLVQAMEQREELAQQRLENFSTKCML
jgi:aspartate ammonia-lyase